jgi:hypothetical protein
MIGPILGAMGVNDDEASFVDARQRCVIASGLDHNSDHRIMV